MLGCALSIDKYGNMFLAAVQETVKQFYRRKYEPFYAFVDIF
jgi:hypothetical protein